MARVGADWDTQPELRRDLDEWRNESLLRLDPSVRMNVLDRRERVGAERRIAEGGYRKRQLLELLQNGVDAAEGDHAQITLRLDDDVLYVANTGTPLTREGLDALLTSHNSPKRGQIGKFGLGFKSLLGISDRVDLLSRTVSLRFDRNHAESVAWTQYPSLRGEAVPVMRMAWPLSPAQESRHDKTLASLMRHHATVVRVYLRDEDARALAAEELVELRNEFLFFTGKNIVFQRGESRVEVQREADGALLLLEGDESSRWKVFTRVVTVPDERRDVLRDAGSLYETKDLPIAWAVPLDRKRDFRAEFWSFFPLVERNRVPGILNAPFKTNDDRSNLIEGEYNQFLLTACAELIIESLPTLRTSEDPGRHLDFLPRQRDGNNLARILGEEVWRIARTVPLAPDSDGTLRLASSLLSPPTTDRGLFTTWMALASPEARGAYAHPDVLREDGSQRAGRWEALGPKKKATAGEWIQALPAPTVAAVVARLKLLAAFCGKTEHRTDTKADPLEGAQTWKILVDQNAHWRTGPELLLEGDASELRVHPLIFAERALHPLLQRLGVRTKDAAWHRERQEAARRVGNWGAFWEHRRAAPAEARVSGLGLCLRTRAGTWRPANRCILGEDFADETGAYPDQDPCLQYLADVIFHTPEELAAAGFDASVNDHYLEGWQAQPLAIFSSWYSQIYNHFRSNHPRGRDPTLISGPKVGMLIDLITVEHHREYITQLSTGRNFAHVTFGYRSSSTEYPDPEAFAVKEHGRFNGYTYAFASLIRGCKELVEFLEVPIDSFLVAWEHLGAWQNARPEDLHAAARVLLPLVSPEHLAVLAVDDRRKVYEHLARINVLPNEFLVGDQVVARADLVVGIEPSGDSPVLVVSQGALSVFKIRKIKVLQPPPPPIVAAEPVTLVPAEEVLPWLASVLKDDVEALVERRELAAGESAAARPDSTGRHLLLIESDTVHASRAQVLDAVEKLGWLMADRATAEGSLDAAARERSNVRQGSFGSLPERLLAVAGRDAIAAHLYDVRGLLSRVSDVAVAEVFLARHGPGALRVLAETLRQRGYAPPYRWGGAAAREFVESMGFPPEFAGSPTNRREPYVEVEGPVDCPELHGFQREVYAALDDVLQSTTERAMVCLPTGAGKTRVVVECIVERLLRTDADNRLVIWVAQQDELCEQAVETFRLLWRAKGRDEVLTISRLWAGNRPLPAPAPHVVVATMQTLLNRFNDTAFDWLRRPSVIVVDEAHHGVTPSYTALLDWLDQRRIRSIPLIGLSATPHRGSAEEESRRLARRFGDRLIPSADRQMSLHDELERLQVLAVPRYSVLQHSPQQILSESELQHVKTFHDLPPSVAERLGDDPQRNEQIVAWVRHGGFARMLLFAASVRHAHWLAAALTLAGCPAAAIDGSTPTATRRFFLKDFRRGRLRALVNYGVLTTGFDEPLVDAVIIARPTLSPVLYTQMVGRGLRGRANGGTEQCAIVTVRDNWDRYRDDPAWKWYVDYWASAPGVPGAPPAASRVAVPESQSSFEEFPEI